MTDQVIVMLQGITKKVAGRTAVNALDLRVAKGAPCMGCWGRTVQGRQPPYG